MNNEKDGNWDVIRFALKIIKETTRVIELGLTKFNNVTSSWFRKQSLGFCHQATRLARRFSWGEVR